MKLLLSSLFLLFTAQMVAAQSCLLFFTTADSLPNGSVFVTAHMSGSSPTYAWNNGSTSATIEITEPGTYTCYGTDGDSCTVSDSIVLECETRIRQEGNSIKAYKLLAGTGFSYLWNTGETTQTISPYLSGDYCVTVTGGTNDCSGGIGQHTNSNCLYFYSYNICSAYIEYLNDNTLSATGNGLAPYTYQWSPGNYTTQNIDPGVPGQYCVTITDAGGCESYFCRDLFDPAQCDVTIYFSPDSSATGGWLFTDMEGQWDGDWTYLWSDGSDDSGVYPLNGGSYCVTVTNIQTGCTSSNCFWYWPDSLCYAQINLDSVGINSAFLSVSGNPFPIVSYQWNNGSTSAINESTNPGWQTVTVTNSEGCIVNASYYLYENESLITTITFPDSLDFGNNGTFASVYLIEYDTAQGGILTAIDTIETHSWSNAWALGQFYNVPSGQYLLKAALLPNSSGYNEHLPTYYPNVVLWSQATPVTFRKFGPLYQQVNIVMAPGQNPGGPGFIGGLVSQGANVHSGGNGAESFGEGDPMAGVTVILSLPDGTLVAAVVTDATGAYSFGNIAWGTYIITIDVPGLPLVTTNVTIDQNNPTASNINFKVDDNSIATAVTSPDFKNPVKVFPNPAADLLFIETPEAAAISLLDTHGKVVLNGVGTNVKTKLSIEHLESGIYFLTVRTAGTTEIVKVIKQ